MKKYAKRTAAEDNVATCVADLVSGEEVYIKTNGGEIACKANTAIPFGHKIALRDIRQGAFVYKYGEAIGKATQDIKTGDWVHTHNVVDHYEVL